ncbi:MAG: efflux RND transporter permease subunit, partial [Pseudomonadota bacterium]
PGASPEKIEQLVTDKIEKSLQEISEIDYIDSRSRTGVSIIEVNFYEKYTDMRPLFNKIRRNIDDLKDENTLPSESLGPFINDEYGDVFGILYSLKGKGFSFAELDDFADEVRNILLNVKNIAKVNIHGAQDEKIYLEYDGAKLQDLSLTPSLLTSILQNANILDDGGDILVGKQRLIIEPTGYYKSLDEIAKTVIKLPGKNDTVYLEDIVDIKRGYVDPIDSIIRHNNENSLLIAISLQDGGDILALDEELAKVMPSIEASLPLGITIKKVFSQPKLVRNSVASFMNNLVQSVLIVAGLMFVFLGLRTGLIVASLIPITIMASLVFMTLFDITINQISLAALIIALGLLVDNAIVITESIMIKRENGMNKYQAAIDSGKEMAIPLLISSLTTAAAFLAIFLAESAVGEYTADIFKVVTIALLSSWIFAMTFIPMVTIILMKIKQSSSGSADIYSGLMYKIYRKILFPSLRYKIIPIIVIISLFITAIWALKFVPQVFIPEREDPIINAKFELPRGTDISVINEIIADLETYMLNKYDGEFSENGKDIEQNGITDIVSFIGVGTPRYVLAINPDQENTHRGAMIIQLTDHHIIPEIIKDVQEYSLQKYPDLVVHMRKMENGTPIDYPIEIRVTGNDIDKLYEIISPIKEKLLSIEGVRGVNDDWGMKRRKLVIKVDQNRAKRAGVTNSDIASSLNTVLSGIETTDYREDNDVIPIILRSSITNRNNIDKLDGLIIYSQSSNDSVPLKQVADIELVFENAIIKRRDRMRTITIRTMHYPGVTATEVANQITPFLLEQQKNWPANYSYEMGGEMETSTDSSQAIAAKLPISGMIILLLLMAQFNSFRKTFVILLTIPLGVIGVTFGLIVGNSIFGFFTILGLISLSGIIINNAIVLIDRINIEIEENGLKPSLAVVEACQQRLRPIILTTFTTVGGMLPLWISHDPMFETMAISIIFGLLFATILTLIFVPVLYSIFFRIKYNDIFLK